MFVVAAAVFILENRVFAVVHIVWLYRSIKMGGHYQFIRKWNMIYTFMLDFQKFRISSVRPNH